MTKKTLDKMAELAAKYKTAKAEYDAANLAHATEMEPYSWMLDTEKESDWDAYEKLDFDGYKKHDLDGVWKRLRKAENEILEYAETTILSQAEGTEKELLKIVFEKAHKSAVYLNKVVVLALQLVDHE